MPRASQRRAALLERLAETPDAWFFVGELTDYTATPGDRDPYRTGMLREATMRGDLAHLESIGKIEARREMFGRQTRVRYRIRTPEENTNGEKEWTEPGQEG